ncbi:MAG: hypothetical protein JKX84_08105 [Flavobacteriales bacterium]|nr:hypothetical protein [Flavobacteriales bacterium]
MGSLTLSNKTLDRYFSFLKKLDNGSKRNLIIKLKESLEPEKTDSFDLKSIFGAWEDTRESDEIIRQIRDSRVEGDDIAEMG